MTCQRVLFGETAKQECWLPCTGICNVRRIEQGRRGRSVVLQRESAGSSKMRNLTCAMEDDFLRKHTKDATHTLEPNARKSLRVFYVRVAGAEAVRQHNVSNCPYQSWCEMCVASKRKSVHYHQEAPQSKDSDVAGVQMDFMFVGAEEKFVD